LFFFRSEAGMFQRIATCPLSLRAGLRVQTWLLCVCLIVPLAWHESGFSASVSDLPAHALFVADYPGGQGADVRRESAPQHLPVLVPASNLASGTGLRSGNRDDDPASAHASSPWTALGAVFRLSSLRIDPVAWDSGTPSFLLPSAYGLVLFALPPPSCLV
jgi:hypothetical protein